MKNFLAFLSTLLFLKAGAAHYFVAASGSDAHTGVSSLSAWQTTAKVNAAILYPGDSVFFNRGDVFYGFLTIHYSGSAGKPIWYGAYGSGPDPVITGFTTVKAWTNLGSHIWESTDAVSTLPLVNIATVNGMNTAMGRFPNASAGYLPFQTHSANTSITSSSLTGEPNWTGADLVIKKEKWIIDRCPVTAQSGGTLTYSSGIGLPYLNGQAYKAHDGWGFFIQNDIRTLDTANEWFYNPSSRKLDIYAPGKPPVTAVSTIDTLVNIQSVNEISFDHIRFTGANAYAFFISRSRGIQIQYCTIDDCYNGVKGLNGEHGGSARFLFENNSVNHCGNNAVDMPSEFTQDSILHNLIRNTGIFPGMGSSGDGQYRGIHVTGTGSVVMYNEVDSTGYIGIGFRLSNINISYNYIHDYCFVKDDGGGIYTQGIATGNRVAYNIVVNGIGSLGGTPNGFPGGNGMTAAYGIYCDDFASGIEVVHNTVANTSFAGIFLHNANDVKILDNTSYNSGKSAMAISDNIAGLTRRGGIICEGNIFFQKEPVSRSGSKPLCLSVSTLYNDLSSLGSFDHNFYARPADDDLVFDIDSVQAGGKHGFYNLSGWQALHGADLHSRKSPVVITNTSDVFFEYNATESPVSVPLSFEYVDLTGQSYTGSVTLAPYSSLVLIKSKR